MKPLPIDDRRVALYADACDEHDAVCQIKDVRRCDECKRRYDHLAVACNLAAVNAKARALL